MARMRFDRKDNDKQLTGPFAFGSTVLIQVKQGNGHCHQVRGTVAQVISDKQIVVNTAIGHLLADISDCKPI